MWINMANMPGDCSLETLTAGTRRRRLPVMITEGDAAGRLSPKFVVLG